MSVLYEKSGPLIRYHFEKPKTPGGLIRCREEHERMRTIDTKNKIVHNIIGSQSDLSERKRKAVQDILSMSGEEIAEVFELARRRQTWKT